MILVTASTPLFIRYCGQIHSNQRGELSANSTIPSSRAKMLSSKLGLDLELCMR